MVTLLTGDNVACASCCTFCVSGIVLTESAVFITEADSESLRRLLSGSCEFVVPTDILRLRDEGSCNELSIPDGALVITASCIESIETCRVTQQCKGLKSWCLLEVNLLVGFLRQGTCGFPHVVKALSIVALSY